MVLVDQPRAPSLIASAEPLPPEADTGTYPAGLLFPDIKRIKRTTLCFCQASDESAEHGVPVRGQVHHRQ